MKKKLTILITLSLLLTIPAMAMAAGTPFAVLAPTGEGNNIAVVLVNFDDSAKIEAQLLSNLLPMLDGMLKNVATGITDMPEGCIPEDLGIDLNSLLGSANSISFWGPQQLGQDGDTWHAFLLSNYATNNLTPYIYVNIKKTSAHYRVEVFVFGMESEGLKSDQYVIGIDVPVYLLESLLSLAAFL